MDDSYLEAMYPSNPLPEHLLRKRAFRLPLAGDLAQRPPSKRNLILYERNALRLAYGKRLDRVNVLGNDGDYGHTGCVNALSWALGGEMLITAGDDTTVRLWKLDSTDSNTPYPYKCDAVVKTGHTGNIFNAHLLPSSSKIATVAGDGQVRISDVERALTTSSVGREREFNTRDTQVRVLKCHRGRTKRIVTEESSDVFLAVAEDGTVRQHDLRTPHTCRKGCPPPLVKFPYDLSTLSLSPLAPYMFVVAGESPYGFLFDRRQTGRVLQTEWGRPCNSDDYVSCVRRFGRKTRGHAEEAGSEHVTGARMAQSNSYEVLLSYSSDAVYLYSVYDESHNAVIAKSSRLPSNSRKRKASSDDTGSSTSEEAMTYSDIDALLDNAERMEAEEDVEEFSDDEDADNTDIKFRTPIVLPRRRFSGACNVETIKDVNFVGPEDEYVASGSDDGNFFLWDKQTGRLAGVYEGDGQVVNVIEGHPRLPLIAVSGIDTTVKLFAPTNGVSEFSRIGDANDIMESNVHRGRTRQRLRLSQMLLRYRPALRMDNDEGDDDSNIQCTYQ